MESARKYPQEGDRRMRKWGWALLGAFCTLVFLLLASALVEGPPDMPAAAGERRPLVNFAGPISGTEQKAGDQQAPFRADVEQRVLVPARPIVIVPKVKADANGHPLSGSTYIMAVYQAFWLGDRSG